MLELEQVAHLGTPEPVDALVRVAHDTDVAVGLSELDHQLVLRNVGVLVLVHEDVLEAFLIVLEHVGMLAEHPHGANQEVVEVHRVGRHETPLVLGVSLGDPPLVDRPCTPVESRHVHHVGLRRADDAEDGPGGKPSLVDADVIEDVFHEPAAVALVVDRERRPIADPVGVAAQHPDARGMEGGHPHSLGVRADKLHDATAHLVRGLVGEGDGEYPPGRHTRDDEAGDTAGQDAGLPGPGTGHHDKGAALVQDRFALSRVQVRDKVCDLPRHRLCGCRGLLLLGFGPAAPRSGAGPRAGAGHRGGPTRRLPMCRQLAGAKTTSHPTLPARLTAPGIAVRPRCRCHSHSIVPGGLEVTS